MDITFKRRVCSRGLRSFGLLRSEWSEFTDVSGQPIGTFFKGLLNMVPIGRPKTSGNHQHTRRNKLEGRRLRLHSGGSLNSRIVHSYRHFSHYCQCHQEKNKETRQKTTREACIRVVRISIGTQPTPTAICHVSICPFKQKPGYFKKITTPIVYSVYVTVFYQAYLIPGYVGPVSDHCVFRSLRRSGSIPNDVPSFLGAMYIDITRSL